MQSQLLVTLLCSIAFSANAQGNGWPPPRLNSDTWELWLPLSNSLFVMALAAAVIAILGIVLLIRLLWNKREEHRPP
jgi:hypothetical protein